MQAAAALGSSLIQRLPSGLQGNIPYTRKSLSDSPLPWKFPALPPPFG